MYKLRKKKERKGDGMPEYETRNREKESTRGMDPKRQQSIITAERNPEGKMRRTKLD